jgi:hypothetical protein
MRGARQTPLYDPLSHLVYVTRGDDVRTTVVQGPVLMHDRRVLTLDEPAVLAEAARHTRRRSAAVRRRCSEPLLSSSEQIQERMQGHGRRDRGRRDAGPETPSTSSACSRARSCSSPISSGDRGRGDLDFIAVSSYGPARSTGEVQMLKDLDTGIEDRYVVIVEDIVDTGLTLTYLQDILRSAAAEAPDDGVPAEQALAAEGGRPVDYVGFRSRTTSSWAMASTSPSSTGTCRTSRCSKEWSSHDPPVRFDHHRGGRARDRAYGRDGGAGRGRARHAAGADTLRRGGSPSCPPARRTRSLPADLAPVADIGGSPSVNDHTGIAMKRRSSAPAAGAWR